MPMGVMAGDIAIVLSTVYSLCPIPVSISIHHFFPRVKPRVWGLSHGSWCLGTRGSPELRVLLVPCCGMGTQGRLAQGWGLRGLGPCSAWGQRNPVTERNEVTPFQRGDVRPLPVALGTLAWPCGSGMAGREGRVGGWGQLVALGDWELCVTRGMG